MRLISWNVARAGPARIARQVAALAARAPDIVAVQEVRVNRVAEFRSALIAAGFPSVVDGFQSCDDAFTGCRASGVLVASIWPCAVADTPDACALPWPERLLIAAIATPWGCVHCATLYVPTGYSGRNLDIRIATLEGVYAGLARHSETPRILCGDFNLPQSELADGTLITFGQTRRASGAFAVTHAAMDASERKVLMGLAAFGLVDAYRAVHGYDRQEFSWYHPASGNGFRLDHVLASPSLRPQACRYLDAFRTETPEQFPGLGFTKLSDHAAIEAIFAPEGKKD